MVQAGLIGVSENLPDSDMLEKKNKRQFMILVALVSATAIVYWLGGTDDGYAVDIDIFRKFDAKAIDEVELTSPNGAVALKYTGSRWTVNDEYGADPGMIDVLFATLQQAEPRRPMASAAQDSLAAYIRQNGVKVSLISANEAQESFFAGGNATRSQAYFMDDDGVVYLMTIPGYRVYVSGIFELDANGWRNKFVFGFNWRNFQRMEVNFPGRSTDNFVVAMDDKFFSIPGMTQVDTTKLNDFLDDVSLLTVQEYQVGGKQLDSLAKINPLVDILVNDVARKEYRLQLFPPLGTTGQYMGLINGSQWASFPDGPIKRIVRPRSFFGK